MIMDRRNQGQTRQAGFTLLEILIALSIVALMSVGAFRLISTTINTHKSSGLHTQQFNQLGNMLGLMERDLLQAINRPVRDEFGDPLPGFIGDTEGFQFSHVGWANRPRGLQSKTNLHSNIQRSACALELQASQEPNRPAYQYYWGCKHWDVLDRVQHSKAITNLSIAVTGVTLRYLDHSHIWQNHWPTNTASQSESGNQRLPLALEIKITSQQFGTLRRLYQLGSPTPSGVAR